MADADADPDAMGGNTGCVFLIDDGGAVSSWITSDDFVDPVDVAVAGDGAIFILDRGATPFGPAGGTGAIFRVEAGQTEPLLFASSPWFASPAEMCWDAQGNLIVADEHGNPSELSGNVGALFRISPTGDVSVLAGNLDLVDPSGVALDDDGTLLVADQSADPLGDPANGALLRVDGSGQVSVVAAEPVFADPVGVTVTTGGTYLVVDESADPFSIGQPGAIFEVTAAGDLVNTVVSSLLSCPQEIVQAPGDTYLLVDRGLGDAGGLIEFSATYESDVWLLDPRLASPMGLAAVPTARGEGDINGDGQVDLEDFITFASCFGLAGGAPGSGCTAAQFEASDLNSDGWIDLSDFTIFAASFGT